MDFGEILEKWEAGRKQQTISKRREPVDDGGFAQQIERYLPKEADWEQLIGEKELPDTDPVLRRSTLRRIAPEAEIDLHGMTRDEAVTALDRFFREAASRDLQKVLIIHGKGNHSDKDGAVLPDVVREYLQYSPIAGESGQADRSLGGSGATWVILKE